MSDKLLVVSQGYSSNNISCSGDENNRVLFSIEDDPAFAVDVVKRFNAYPKLVQLLKESDKYLPRYGGHASRTLQEKNEALLTELEEM